MLSNACKYAINAVLYLSIESSIDHKKSVKDISEALNIPFAFLAQLLQMMAKKNLISSQKGPRGGFYLTEDNNKQKLITLVAEIDGLEKFDVCAMGLAECNSLRPCPLHTILEPVRKNLLIEISKNSIHHYAQRVKSGEVFLSF